MPRSTLTALLAGSLLASLVACAQPPGTVTPGDLPPRDSTGPKAWDATAAQTAVTALPASLIERFAGCEDLLTYYQANALEQVGPYGIGGYHYGYAEEGAMADDGDAAAGAESGGAAPEHSTTNVQEEGVDEADLVKTDGNIIVTTITGKVQVVDVASEEVISTVQLPGQKDAVYAGELLLHGSTLVVLSHESTGYAPVDTEHHMAFPSSRTVVTTVDLSDPANPRTIGSARIEGSYQSARMVGETVRMVMVSEPPSVEQSRPQDNRLTSEEEAEETNRQLILDTEIDDWIPHVQKLDADGRALGTERLLDCDAISRPRDPAGLSTMSVLSFDIGSGTPQPTSGAGLVATGSTVYASTDRLIVATNRWDQWRWAGSDLAGWGGGSTQTDLHSFDISDPDGTAYQASGTVGGFLLSQWALDEQDGVIRVATTTDPRGSSQESESSLITMREDGDTLTETGRVDGLGVTEQVRAVRYLSPELAAVVTFRQTDPLYLIDTSDPTQPQVTGELKIPGYSAYLHPIDEDTLLGVGQDADPENGQTEGTQVSLFDISDLSAPQQTEVLTWKDSYTTAEWDHRAFTYWPTTEQVFLPLTRWAEEKDEHFSGVVVLGVDGESLTEEGKVSVAPKQQEYWGEGPSRTIVIGDDLWTLDYQGLARFDLDTLTGGWAVDLL